MRFSDLMRSIRRDAGTSTLDVPEDWLQGRSVFGGLQVALVVDAMRALVPATVPLRTLQVTFVAPVTADRFDHWPLQGWRADVEMVAARDGYTNQSTLLWAPDGALAAISRQSMMVFG